MIRSNPIRLLLVSSRRSRRAAVRAALEFKNSRQAGAFTGRGEFSIIETSRAEKIPTLVASHNVQAVILARPEIHELMCDFVGTNPDEANAKHVPIIVTGSNKKGLTSSELKKAKIDGYLPHDELYKLPSLLIGKLGVPSGVLDASAAPPEDISSPVAVSEQHAMQLHLMNPQAVRESQKLISIGRLAAEIAHEINNPLESVGNLIYLAQCETGLPERAGEYLRSAERELARVVQISKQTLSFHRESNEPTKLQISELMDEVVSLYSRRIQRKNLSVVREYAGGHAITALPGEVRQVLSNLVTNAIEASSMGGKLRLRIREACKWTGADSPKGLRITVADSGSGISDENRRRLGELFFTTKGQSGTGLGLWVTKSIVARYGGTLKLKSSTGRRHGTVFSLFLPFNSRIGAQDTQQNPASALVDQRTLGKRGNVMEISDHPSHHDNHTHHPANAHHLSVNGFTQKRNG